MFTGIVETTAEILLLEGSKLSIERPGSFADIHLGSSIAVNGCCLTVSAMDDRSFSFDLTHETLAKTTFSLLSASNRVNLERALRSGDRLDGHTVQGHVEDVGTVTANAGENLEVRVQKEIMKNVFPKGSIAIDGVSLTVAEIRGDTLRFAIVPFTRQHTVMSQYREGTPVNIETDILTRSA